MAWHPFRNIWLKIAALALATLLWFTVSGQQVERKVPGVQVSYRNLPTSLEITDQVDSVDVHVRGVDSQITALQPGELVVEVDLRGEGEGSRRLTLRTDQVKTPLGVEVTQVDPGSVPITLERSGMAEVKIAAQIEGEPEVGFVVTEVTIEPAAVTAIGPERRLTASTRAVTERVSVAGANKTVTATVPVGIDDALLRLRQPQAARVTVRIEPAGTRAIAIRVMVRNLAPGRTARVEPELVTMTLRGAVRVLDALNPATVMAYVDAAGLDAGPHDLAVHVDLDGRFALAAIKPATVALRVR